MTCRMTKPMTNALTAFPQHAALGHQMFVFELRSPIAELPQTQSVHFAIFVLVQIASEPLSEMSLPKSAQNLASELYLAYAHDLFSSELFCSRRKITSFVSRTIVQRMDAYTNSLFSEIRSLIAQKKFPVLCIAKSPTTL